MLENRRAALRRRKESRRHARYDGIAEAFGGQPVERVGRELGNRLEIEFGRRGRAVRRTVPSIAATLPLSPGNSSATRSPSGRRGAAFAASIHTRSAAARDQIAGRAETRAGSPAREGSAAPARSASAAGATRRRRAAAAPASPSAAATDACCSGNRNAHRSPSCRGRARHRRRPAQRCRARATGEHAHARRGIEAMRRSATRSARRTRGARHRTRPSGDDPRMSRRSGRARPTASARAAQHELALGQVRQHIPAPGEIDERRGQRRQRQQARARARAAPARPAPRPLRARRGRARCCPA